jgi:hypothetical protein
MRSLLYAAVVLQTIINALPKGIENLTQRAQKIKAQTFANQLALFAFLAYTFASFA